MPYDDFHAIRADLEYTKMPAATHATIMNPSSTLCYYCAKIPFDSTKLYERWGGFSLGTVQRIRLNASHCSLCRLASFAINEHLRTKTSMTMDYSPEQELELLWLRWSPHGSFLGLGAFRLKKDVEVNICFNAASIGQSIEKLEGQLLLGRLSNQVDLQRVRSWISTCLNGHGDECHSSVDSACDSCIATEYAGLELMRFIDVENKCVVETRRICRYVALSYVWGNSINFRLTLSNKTQLMRAGALREVWSALPCTIQDTISFSHGIGERYLWVDALCLVQDDQDDLDKGLCVMDLVYERAYLTVVAACGNDANSGLPGVQQGTRVLTQYTEEVAPGVEMGLFIGLEQSSGLIEVQV